MPSSLVEKYEIILAADPKSRVFVELARALLERGEHGRAAQVCRKGLEHHPGSVQGRVLLGRALLAGGDAQAALIELESAAAIEPRNPYGWNLAAEVLVEKGLAGRALGMLEKALELQPSNEEVRGWLALARREAGSAKPAGALPGASGGDGEATPGVPPRLARGMTPPDRGPSRPAPHQRRAGSAAGGAAALGSSPAAAGAVPLPSPATTPVPPPFKRPSPRRDTNPRIALEHLPEPGAPPAAKPAGPDASEAARIASEYERELREKLLSKEREPPPTFLRRHWLQVLLVSLGVAGLGGGGLIYRTVRRANRAAEVRTYVEAARKGLARDTAGALREAARVLASARSLDPGNGEAAALSAEVAALLAVDFGDREARELARSLAASGTAGEGALVARYLLAASPAQQRAAAEPLVATVVRAGPLVHALAARALFGRGQTQSALSRLELAAKGSPPSLRAMADLGDYYRERGEFEQALPYYQAALQAHPTHPRAALGAAESRLALRRDAAESLASLQAVESDEGSPPPAADRLRFELTSARVLAALGQRKAAAERLGRASEKLGARPELPAAAAEIHLAAGAHGDAEAEARRAVRLAPREGGYRVLLAKAQNGRGRYRELLRESEGVESRELRFYRGMARYELRDYRGALAELQRTRRESRMPAEAAAYYALAEFGLGREKEARALLGKLVELRSPPALAFVASGHLALARGNAAEAEQDYRQAIDHDPGVVEGHCALGRMLLARGQARTARPFLERAAALNPFHAEAQLALGAALLALGEPRAARDAYGALLAENPHHAPALRGLSAADLAAGLAAEARAAAERAVAADGRSPESWLAAGRAALALGDGKGARRNAERARQLAGKGQAASEAARLLERARRLP